MAVDEVNSVYVGSLPYEANEEMLRDAFGYYGTIVSVKVRPAPPPSSLRLAISRVCYLSWPRLVTMEQSRKLRGLQLLLKGLLPGEEEMWDYSHVIGMSWPRLVTMEQSRKLRGLQLLLMEGLLPGEEEKPCKGWFGEQGLTGDQEIWASPLYPCINAVIWGWIEHEQKYQKSNHIPEFAGEAYLAVVGGVSRRRIARRWPRGLTSGIRAVLLGVGEGVWWSGIVASMTRWWKGSEALYTEIGRPRTCNLAAVFQEKGDHGASSETIGADPVPTGGDGGQVEGGRWLMGEVDGEVGGIDREGCRHGRHPAAAVRASGHGRDRSLEGRGGENPVGTATGSDGEGGCVTEIGANGSRHGLRGFGDSSSESQRGFTMRWSRIEPKKQMDAVWALKIDGWSTGCGQRRESNIHTVACLS
jgi:hypothetical protein